MIARYPRPNIDDGYRANPQECIDRAQRALETAELNLDKVSELLNASANANRITFADLTEHADARTRLGSAWRDLASLKNLDGLP